MSYEKTLKELQKNHGDLLRLKLLCGNRAHLSGLEASRMALYQLSRRIEPGKIERSSSLPSLSDTAASSSSAPIAIERPDSPPERPFYSAPSTTLSRSPQAPSEDDQESFDLYLKDSFSIPSEEDELSSYDDYTSDVSVGDKAETLPTTPPISASSSPIAIGRQAGPKMRKQYTTSSFFVGTKVDTSGRDYLLNNHPVDVSRPGQS